MEDGGLFEEVVSELSWVSVLVEGTEFLAKAWFGDTQYRILLSDLHNVWEEEMHAEAIGERAQHLNASLELNKRLRAPVQSFFFHLCSVAQPRLSGQTSNQDPTEAHFSLLRHDNRLTVRLKSELAGLPFHWEFRLRPAPVTVVCRQLVRPLLAMSRVLQRQVEELTGLLVRKDAEIQDYKENGAVLTRARLLTDVFDEERFKQNFFSQTSPNLVGIWCVCGECVVKGSERYGGERRGEERRGEGLTPLPQPQPEASILGSLTARLPLLGSTGTLPLMGAVQECVGLGPELQELYAAVSSQRGLRKRRRPSSASADALEHEQDQTPAREQPADHSTHTHRDDRSQASGRGHSDQSLTPSLREQNPEELARAGASGEPQKAESEQTVPQMSVPVDRPAARPKKKKAVGLFR